MPANLALPICESCGHAAPDIYHHRLYQPGLCKSPPLEIDVCGNCMNLVKGGIISRKSVIGMIKARCLCQTGTPEIVKREIDKEYRELAVAVKQTENIQRKANRSGLILGRFFHTSTS